VGSTGGTRRNRNARGVRGSSWEPILYSGGVSLGDLEERSVKKTSTSRDKGKVEVNADEVSRDGKDMLLQANARNAARYCVLKVLNTSQQHLESGKHVKLGTTEAILRCAPRVTGFDSRNLEAGETSAGSVNFIRGNNSAELAEVRAELEQRLAHLVIEERQILLPVMSIRTCSVMTGKECCHAPPTNFMRLGQGTPCLLRRILTVYRAHIVTAFNNKTIICITNVSNTYTNFTSVPSSGKRFHLKTILKCSVCVLVTMEKFL